MINKFVKIQAKVLAIVAWSNGEFDQKEKEFYINFLNSLEISEDNFSELKNYLVQSPNKDEVLIELKNVPKEYGIATIKNAYLMAKVSDLLSDKETEILTELAKTYDINSYNITKYFEMLEKYYEGILLEKEIF